MSQPTIACPASIYDEALAACNAKRAKKGMKALAALPPGRGSDPESRPCGSATGVSVGFYYWYAKGGDPFDPVLSARHGMRFPVWFDDEVRRMVQQGEVAANELILPVRAEEAAP